MLFQTATAGVLTSKLNIGNEGDVEVEVGNLIIPTTNKIFLDGSAAGDTSIRESSADFVTHQVGGEAGLRLQEIGTEVNVVLGADNALALTATDGFVYIGGGAGTPTGVPTGYTAKTALFYDTTNNILYANDGGGWSNVGSGGGEVATWTVDHNSGGNNLNMSTGNIDFTTGFMEFGTTPATAGEVRLENTDSIGFRNNENDFDYLLGMTTNNMLQLTLQDDHIDGFQLANSDGKIRLIHGTTNPGEWNAGYQSFSLGTVTPSLASLFIDGAYATALDDTASSYAVVIRGYKDPEGTPVDLTTNGIFAVMNVTERFLSVAANGDVAIANTNKLFLDGSAAGIGGDTSIRESAANIITFEAGGTDAVEITSSKLDMASSVYLNFPSAGRIRWADATERSLLNDTNGFEFRVQTGDNFQYIVQTAEVANISTTGSIFQLEKAAADADVATYGQVWVQNTTLQSLMFTDEAGTDFSASDYKTMNFVINEGGGVLTIGKKGGLIVDANYEVMEWAILSTDGTSGSIVVDVNRATYSGFPTTSTLTASEKPTISSSTKGEDRTLTTWSDLAVGDYIEFEVDSVTSLTEVIVSLKLRPKGG
jgi:hypothetical protein